MKIHSTPRKPTATTKTAKFQIMIPWDTLARGKPNTGISSTLFSTIILNKTVIIFIIYLFISSTVHTCHCRSIYNATNQPRGARGARVQESLAVPPAASGSASSPNHSSSSSSYINFRNSNNNSSNSNYNFQFQNNTNAIVRVIVTKSSSTSYSPPAPAVPLPAINAVPAPETTEHASHVPTVATPKKKRRLGVNVGVGVNDDDNRNRFSQFDSFHDQHFPDLSRLFSSTSATASTVTQSSTSTIPSTLPILPFHGAGERQRPRPRTRTRSFTRTAVTSTTTPTPTTYHPDFFFSPFYSNINRVHPKRKIENRSINKNHAAGGLASFPDYQNHPDNIFSVFYHAFSQQGSPTSPTGSFSFHSQSQQHHHLHHHPNTFPNRNYEPSNPAVVRTEQHQLLSFPQLATSAEADADGGRSQEAPTERIVIPTLPTITANSHSSRVEDKTGKHVISVVSETRSLTAASTAATLSAESHSVSAASTSASSSTATATNPQPDVIPRPQFVSQEQFTNEPTAEAFSSEEDYSKFSLEEYPVYPTLHAPRVRQAVHSDSSQDSEIPDRSSGSLEVESLEEEEASRSNEKLHSFHSPRAQPFIRSTDGQNPTAIIEPTPASSTQWKEPVEHAWGEPERVWGKPEQVWGEPERDWGKPATTQDPPKLFTWPSNRQAKMPHSNLRQLFQRDLSLPSLLHGGGPKIYEIEPKVAHITPGTHQEVFSTTAADRRQDTSESEDDLELMEDETDNAKFYEIGEDEEDEPKELNLDENTMNSTIENAQLAARSWELPELTPSSSLMSPLHHTSSSMPEVGPEIVAESIQIPRNYQNEHGNGVIKITGTININQTHKSLGDKAESREKKSEATGDAIEVKPSPTASEDEAAEKSGNDFESQKTSSQSQPAATNTLSTSERPSKKFGYVLDGSDVRKYRVEERTPDGYIVGEYGVINHDNGFLRGVRYTADGTINPRLIHQALMKFLSLR